MIKNFVVTLAILGLVLSSAFAQNGAEKSHFLAVGARVHYASAEDAFGGDVSVDEEFGYGAMAKLSVFKPLWLRFGIDVFNFEGRATAQEIVDGMPISATASAKLQTIPLTATLLLDLGSLTSSIRPYVGAGIGYYINDFHDVGASASVFGVEFPVERLLNFDFNADDALGWHVCAGVDWFLSSNIAINLEASYRWAEYNWDLAMWALDLSEYNEKFSGSSNLDGWAITAGLSLFFF
jgi:outer membrane protein W